jgi:yecA family protein
MNRSLPAFEDVVEALGVLSSLGTAAESHGLLCALLSADVSLRQEAWVDSLLSEHVEASNLEGQQAYRTLKHLFTVTAEAFAAEDFSLPLLLPDDEVALEDRLDHLAEWCQGYLTGLHLLGVAIQGNQNATLQEAITDLVDISQVEMTPEDQQDPESEVRYLELVEFVKVAVLSIATELHHLFDHAENQKPSVH